MNSKPKGHPRYSILVASVPKRSYFGTSFTIDIDISLLVRSTLRGVTQRKDMPYAYRARIKLPGRKTTFHAVSRVVGGTHLLDDTSKEILDGMIWKLAGFCGVEIITYCVMSNHFHILLRVPEAIQLTDTQLLERIEGLYGSKGTLPLLAREAMTERGQDRRGYPPQVARADGGHLGFHERTQATVQPIGTTGGTTASEPFGPNASRA